MLQTRSKEHKGQLPDTSVAVLLRMFDDLTDDALEGRYERFSGTLKGASMDCNEIRSSLTNWCTRKIACGVNGCAYETPIRAASGAPLVLKAAEVLPKELDPFGDAWAETATNTVMTALMDAGLLPHFVARAYAVTVCKGADVPLAGCTQPPSRAQALRVWQATAIELSAAAGYRDVWGTTIQRARAHMVLGELPEELQHISQLNGSTEGILGIMNVYKLRMAIETAFGVVRIDGRMAWKIAGRARAAHPPVVYTLMETGGGRLSALPSFQQRLCCFLLLAGGLCAAHRAVRFAHSDMHAGNVLTRTRKGEENAAATALVWFADRLATFPLAGKHVPLLIDLGFAGFRPPCAEPTEPRWVADSVAEAHEDNEDLGDIYPGSVAYDLVYFAQSLRRAGGLGNPDPDWARFSDDMGASVWEYTSRPTFTGGHPDSQTFDNALETLVRRAGGRMLNVEEAEREKLAAVGRGAKLLDWT